MVSGGMCSDAMNRTSTNNVKNADVNSVSKMGGITGNKNPMLHKNLSRIIRWYKGRMSFESRKIQIDFAWQPLFYDHIIRNDHSLQNIVQYIITNPQKWIEDEFWNEE